jgi:hypothetical protein
VFDFRAAIWGRFHSFHGRQASAESFRGKYEVPQAARSLNCELFGKSVGHPQSSAPLWSRMCGLITQSRFTQITQIRVFSLHEALLPVKSKRAL